MILSDSSIFLPLLLLVWCFAWGNSLLLCRFPSDIFLSLFRFESELKGYLLENICEFLRHDSIGEESFRGLCKKLSINSPNAPLMLPTNKSNEIMENFVMTSCFGLAIGQRKRFSNFVRLKDSSNECNVDEFRANSCHVTYENIKITQFNPKMQVLSVRKTLR